MAAWWTQLPSGHFERKCTLDDPPVALDCVCVQMCVCECVAHHYLKLKWTFILIRLVFMVNKSNDGSVCLFVSEVQQLDILFK